MSDDCGQYDSTGCLRILRTVLRMTTINKQMMTNMSVRESTIPIDYSGLIHRVNAAL